MKTIIEYDLNKEVGSMKRECIDVYYTLEDNYLCIVYVYEYGSRKCKHSKDVKRLAYIEDENTREYIKSHPYIQL